MQITYKIMFIILVLCSSTVLAADLDKHIKINNTEPNTSTYFTLQVPIDNSTIYINLTNPHPEVNISYDDTVFFGSEFQKNIFFNITVGFLNYNTTIQQVFEITNDYNDIKRYLAIYLNHTYTPPKTIEDPKEMFVRSEIGNYVINLTLNNLPRDGKLGYNVTGTYGEQLNISCPEGWLECPTQTTFKQNNRTIFYINYSVPITAPFGTVIYMVNLTMNNYSVFKNITFNIKEPDLQFINYDSALDPECFIPLENGEFSIKVACMDEVENFMQTQLSNFYKRIYALRNITFECKPEIKKEFIVVGNMSEMMLENYEICKDQRQQFSQDLTKNENLLTQCLNDNKNLQDEYFDNKSTLCTNLYDYAEDKEKNAEFKEERSRKILKKAIWISLILGVSVFIFLVLYNKGVDEGGMF